jgi:hypothetical protein
VRAGWRFDTIPNDSQDPATGPLVRLFRLLELSENNSLPTNIFIHLCHLSTSLILPNPPICPLTLVNDAMQTNHLPRTGCNPPWQGADRGQAVNRFGPLHHPGLTNVTPTPMHNIHASSQTSLMARDVLRTSQASPPLHSEVFDTAYSTSSVNHEEVCHGILAS